MVTATCSNVFCLVHGICFHWVGYRSFKNQKLHLRSQPFNLPAQMKLGNVKLHFFNSKGSGPIPQGHPASCYVAHSQLHSGMSSTWPWKVCLWSGFSWGLVPQEAGLVPGSSRSFRDWVLMVMMALAPSVGLSGQAPKTMTIGNFRLSPTSTVSPFWLSRGLISPRWACTHLLLLRFIGWVPLTSSVTLWFGCLCDFFPN